VRDSPGLAGERPSMWSRSSAPVAFLAAAPAPPIDVAAPPEGRTASLSIPAAGASAADGSVWTATGFAAAAALVGCRCAASAIATSQRSRRNRRQEPRYVAAQQAADSVEAGEVDTFDLGTPFPFSAVVGQEGIKIALLLNMVDPAIGGVLIQGDRGCGKSTLVRSLTRLLPQIPCVADDSYNSNPADPSTMSEDVRSRYENGEELPVAMRRTPFVELPLGATEDRVTGTIDIERALAEGGKAFEPGILARVNRGILYIDECNLLDDQLVDVLLDSAAGGWNTVEREGISIRHPARFVLIGTAHPDEGDLRPQLLDRFGMTVSVRTPNASEWRVLILQRTSGWSLAPEKLEAKWADKDEALKTKILEARERLKDIEVPRSLKVSISKICSKLNVDGMRGDIVTNRACRALAAYEGRTTVTDEDVRRVAVPVLQHRLRKDAISDGIDNSGRVIQALFEEFNAGPPVEQATAEEVYG